MKNCLWLVGLLLLATGLRAQDTLRLDLNKALEIALNDNPTIQIAGKEIERQEYVRKETRGSLYPSLTGTGAYNYAAKKSTMSFGGQKISMEPDNTVTLAASLSLPLFVPGVYQTLKMNDEQMRAAVESARESKISLAAEVKKAYYNILLAQRSLSVLRTSEETITQVVDQTRSLYEQEMASEYDLLTAQVELSNLEPTIIQTANAIQTATQYLKMLLFVPERVPVVLTNNLDELLRIARAEQNASEAPGIAGNSELRQLDIQQSILDRQVKVLRTSRYPTLAAIGSLQYLGRDKISFGGEDSGPSWQNFNPISVGLQASIPIFSGWSNTNREKQVKNNIQQLKLQRDYLAESIDMQARTSFNDMLTAQAKMMANEKAIKQAERGYQIARTRYYADVGTIVELNSAQLSLTQARLNLSQSTYDYLTAQAEYTRILGTEY